MTDVLKARFSAIQQLQAIRAKHHPGSRRYEQVEYALDLALSETRVVNDYLVRNLLRDAKRILDRQAASRSYLTFDHDMDELEQRLPDALVDYNTPEAILAAEQIAQAIVGELTRSSLHARRIMEGLLSGESLVETATEAGISPARVNQLRHAIREHASKYLECSHGQ